MGGNQGISNFRYSTLCVQQPHICEKTFTALMLESKLRDFLQIACTYIRIKTQESSTSSVHDEKLSPTIHCDENQTQILSEVNNFLATRPTMVGGFKSLSLVEFNDV